MLTEIAYVTMDASPEKFDVKAAIVQIDEKPKTLWIKKGEKAGYHSRIDKDSIGKIKVGSFSGNDSVTSIKREGFCLVEDLQMFKQKMYETVLDSIQTLLETGVEMQDRIRYSTIVKQEGLVITTPVSTHEGVE